PEGRHPANPTRTISANVNLRTTLLLCSGAVCPDRANEETSRENFITYATRSAHPYRHLYKRKHREQGNLCTRLRLGTRCSLPGKGGCRNGKSQFPRRPSLPAIRS